MKPTTLVRRINMDLVAVLGAVGVLITTIAGGIGIWWIRILNKRHSLELERAEAERKARREEEAAKRRDRKDSIEDLRELYNETKVQLDDSREQIHNMLNRIAVAENKETACQIRMTRIETILFETQRRLQDTLDYVEDLETALEKADVKVVRRKKKTGPYAPHQVDPPPTGDNNG